MILVSHLCLHFCNDTFDSYIKTFPILKIRWKKYFQFSELLSLSLILCSFFLIKMISLELWLLWIFIYSTWCCYFRSTVYTSLSVNLWTPCISVTIIWIYYALVPASPFSLTHNLWFSLGFWGGYSLFEAITKKILKLALEFWCEWRWMTHSWRLSFPVIIFLIFIWLLHFTMMHSPLYIHSFVSLFIEIFIFFLNLFIYFWKFTKICSTFWVFLSFSFTHIKISHL